MAIFKIEKSTALTGEIDVQGSKNSVLPILAATVLTEAETCIHNCPNLSDVSAAAEILKSLGCSVERKAHTLTVNASSITNCEIPDCLMQKMRSSVMFLGAILARTGRAVLTSPGGCDIGKRPIDLHISAVKKLGAKVKTDCNKLIFSAENGLKGSVIKLPFPSVGATENILLASCTAKGKTVIFNAACEPEIADLAAFLNSAGAKVRIIGRGIIEIEPVKRLYGAEYTVMTDRIAAGSYLLSSAATGGRITLGNVYPLHIAELLSVLSKAGCKVETDKCAVRVTAPPHLESVGHVATMPYPGFPTDLQAPLCAALCRANGVSAISERIFESRFKYITELKKLGADIVLKGRTAVINGVPALCSAQMKAQDLRGGFALIIAALQAQGESEITNIEHIDRGYESPETVLTLLGARIKRIE